MCSHPILLLKQYTFSTYRTSFPSILLLEILYLYMFTNFLKVQEYTSIRVYTAIRYSIVYIYIQTLDLECNILILWTENLLRNLYVPLFKSFRTIGFYRMVCQVVTFFGPQRMFLCILLWYIMMELVNQIATHPEHGLNNNNANYKFWN